ncbi:Glutathione transferase FosA [Sulfitobacter sp. THAF37]|uniref:VOC family protein n=1 Tax=Sulfitobacter sp. THAF37 TaxID=2587855 RepID=UPI001268504C|nr:VOC family protein [Sulfitobacter sp. THAF37]QFT58726.1 Glutathione transferase FosA [Sulfitobacter sp. THAF37]
MSQPEKTKLVGVNHLVLEVGDLEEALAFYRAVFDFDLRGRSDTMAFIDMGDQFLVLSQGRDQAPDEGRHFGLVVEDRSGVPARVRAAGGTMLDTGYMDFHDPWGNRVQVVDYRDLQFTKTDAVLRKIGVSGNKTDDAQQELRDKGML